MAPSTCPLLIESRKLINSLGYIDTEYKSPLRQQQVQAQICAEMATFSPQMDEYLAFLPSYSPSFGGKTRLQAEFKRVSANVSLNAIDMRRYNVLEPTGKHAKSLEAWEQAVKQLQVAIEHQSSRVINLELQQGYGTKLAKVRTAVMGGMNQQYERAVEEVKAGSVEINRARQQDQMRNVAKLRSYHSTYLPFHIADLDKRSIFIVFRRQSSHFQLAKRSESGIFPPIAVLWNQNAEKKVKTAWMQKFGGQVVSFSIYETGDAVVDLTVDPNDSQSI